jgi:putative endonuclease
MEEQAYIYFMSNRYNKVLYVGITSNLIKRVWEHKNKVVDGFTKRYNLNKLVYYEIYDDIETAINREKQIKSWSRKKKAKLNNAFNPSWDDLFEKLSK